MSDEYACERQSVLFSGQVQGVGFRYTAQRIAGRYDLSGYVCNLFDGRVKLVVEGSREELQRFLAELSGVMREYVRHSEVEVSPATGEFDGFTVRRA